MGNLIGVRLGDVVSFFLLVGAFLLAEDDVFAVFQGAAALGVVLALLAATIWCAHWLSGRRVAGRSTGGVFRDIRYTLEDITRR